MRSRRGSAVIFIRLIKNQFFGRQRFLIINVIIAFVIRERRTMTVSNMSELYITENPPQSKKITAGSVKKPKIVMFTTVGRTR